MVAVKNLSIASAVLLIAEQGLAAPINTRAPRRGVKSGIANNLISTGGQVAAAALGARDAEESGIYTRAPRRGVKSGIANNLISTGGQVAAAALGARDVDELDERDFEDELDERDIMEEIYARYLDEAEDFEY